MSLSFDFADACSASFLACSDRREVVAARSFRPCEGGTLTCLGGPLRAGSSFRGDLHWCIRLLSACTLAHSGCCVIVELESSRNGVQLWAGGARPPRWRRSGTEVLKDRLARGGIGEQPFSDFSLGRNTRPRLRRGRRSRCRADSGADVGSCVNKGRLL